jgi:AcrR family transcriptional regulator
MARPSSRLDKKMLDAGRKIVSKEGSGNLSIPRICMLAKANLGMFNYHFGTKENYIKLLYTNIKDEVTNYLDLASVKDKNALERIKYVMMKINVYIQKNPKLAESLFYEVLMHCGKGAIFVEKGIIPRFDHIIILIEEAQKEKLLDPDVPTAEIFGALVFGVIGTEIFKKYLLDTEKIYQFSTPSVKDFSFEKKLDIVLHPFIM